jgi:hypothetical protein
MLSNKYMGCPFCTVTNRSAHNFPGDKRRPGKTSARSRVEPILIELAAFLLQIGCRRAQFLSRAEQWIISHAISLSLSLSPLLSQCSLRPCPTTTTPSLQSSAFNSCTNLLDFATVGTGPNIMKPSLPAITPGISTEPAPTSRVHVVGLSSMSRTMHTCSQPSTTHG